MNEKLFTMRKKLLLLITANLLVILVISSCRKESPAPVQPVVTWQYIETYDLPKLYHILNEEVEEFLAGSTMHLADFQGQFSVPEYPVKLYRVTYPTLVPELGISTVASGHDLSEEAGGHEHSCDGCINSLISCRQGIQEAPSLITPPATCIPLSMQSPGSMNF